MTGEQTADVCVVGAGYTGLSASLQLAQAGYKVCVLEAETVGFGASGRNGGQICTGFSPGQARVVAQVGEADAQKCFDLAEEAKALVAERIATHKIDCDLTWGYLHVATKPSRVRDLHEMQEEWSRYGYHDHQLLSKAELEERLGTSIYHGALREGGAGHFHPLNYCIGLSMAASQAGAQIFERSRVVRLQTEGQPQAWTDTGSVKAQFMIIACDAYAGRLVNKLYYGMMPVTSFVVASEKLGANRARSLIRDNEAVADTNWVLDYFRRTSDERLLFGGRAAYSKLEPLNLKANMKRRMLRIFPQLEDVGIEYAWGGYIGITHNRLPDIGRMGHSTYYAYGYSGQGVALANLYGKLIAEVIRGQSERFDLLARFKHFPFPGGDLRLPILVAAMAWYRLRDALS
ncbi:MAG TPA: FAD-binding oxidoreductase [Aestuariivirgaceae bacterium]